MSSFAWILSLSLTLVHCAGSDDPDPDSNQIHSDGNLDEGPGTLEEDAKPSPQINESFFVRGCKEFKNRKMNEVKVSGAESVVKLRDENNGLHLKVMIQESEATIRIAPTPLQSNLQRLCISVPAHVQSVKLQFDMPVETVIVRSEGHNPRVEIDTGDRGALQKLRAEAGSEAPTFFLKGLGMGPCQKPSDAYYCE